MSQAEVRRFTASFEDAALPVYWWHPHQLILIQIWRSIKWNLNVTMYMLGLQATAAVPNSLSDTCKTSNAAESKGHELSISFYDQS
jgi:hypothetical protein